MAEKITNLEELRKWAEGCIRVCDGQRSAAKKVGNAFDVEMWAGAKRAYEELLEKIAELEAALRERMIDGNCVTCGWNVCPHIKECITCPIKAEELRRVLGEAETPEAKRKGLGDE